MSKIFTTTGFILLLILAAVPEADAQCAMCRATVENNVADGVDRIGAGLNFGIIYLLVTPYILIGTLAFLWYRSSKRSSEKKIKIEKIIRSKISPVQ